MNSLSFAQPILAKRLLLAPLVVAALLLAAGRLEADPPDESDPEGTSSASEKLQGTWRVLSMTHDGRKLEPSEFDNVRLIVDENQYTFKTQKGERRTGTLKLLPGKKPPVIETTYAEQPEQGKTVRRIYEWIDKDTIKFCAPGPDENTPDNFEAPQGSKRELTVWKRTDN